MQAMLNNEQEPKICIEQALEATRLSVEDPVAFTKRMVGFMKWQSKQYDY